MKVRELIEELKKADQEAEVIMSSDGEGNDYSPLADLGEGIYVADSTYSGTIYSEDEKEEYEGEDTVKAVVLWPTN